MFDISLFDLFPNGIDIVDVFFGEVGIVARAISAVVDSSVTNFSVTGFGDDLVPV